MNAIKTTSEYRLKQWIKLVQDRDSSGLTIKAYCESIGMAEHSYYHRLRKVREAACGELSKLESGPSGGLTTTMFTEVKLSDSPKPHPSAEVHGSHVSIETPGLRITAGSDYPIHKLTEILHAVIRPCY